MGVGWTRANFSLPLSICGLSVYDQPLSLETSERPEHSLRRPTRPSTPLRHPGRKPDSSVLFVVYVVPETSKFFFFFRTTQSRVQRGFPCTCLSYV